MQTSPGRHKTYHGTVVLVLHQLPPMHPNTDLACKQALGHDLEANSPSACVCLLMSCPL